jgi:hypothetical protein
MSTQETGPIEGVTKPVGDLVSNVLGEAGKAVDESVKGIFRGGKQGIVEAAQVFTGPADPKEWDRWNSENERRADERARRSALKRQRKDEAALEKSLRPIKTAMGMFTAMKDVFGDMIGQAPQAPAIDYDRLGAAVAKHSKVG